jgi:hypothetical protein
MHQPDVDLQEGQDAPMGNAQIASLALLRTPSRPWQFFSGALPLSVNFWFYE